MQIPWLGDARCKVYRYSLDNYLANEVSLSFSIPIFRRETCFENDINCGTHVYLVHLSVNGHTNVLLLAMEQHGKRGGPGGGIGRTKFPRRSAVVYTMLREEGRKIVIDERAKICGECSGLERTEDRGKDGGEFEEELFVVTCDFCPPWIDVCTKGKGYKIIELCI